MKIRPILAAILTTLIALPATAMEIVFKDGTVLDSAKLYIPPAHFFSTGGPTIMGVNLTVNGKLYIHHFPYITAQVVEEQVDDNDDGIYELRKVTRPLTHYRPPMFQEHAPREFGYSCTPSRLPFIHFNDATLVKMRQTLTRHPVIPQAQRQRLAFSIDAARRHRVQPHELHTAKAAATWQAEADRDVELYGENVFYGKWLKNSRRKNSN